MRGPADPSGKPVGPPTGRGGQRTAESGCDGSRLQAPPVSPARVYEVQTPLAEAPGLPEPYDKATHGAKGKHLARPG